MKHQFLYTHMIMLAAFSCTQGSNTSLQDPRKPTQHTHSSSQHIAKNTQRSFVPKDREDLEFRHTGHLLSDEERRFVPTTTQNVGSEQHSLSSSPTDRTHAPKHTVSTHAIFYKGALLITHGSQTFELHSNASCLKNYYSQWINITTDSQQKPSNKSMVSTMRYRLHTPTTLLVDNNQIALAIETQEYVNGKWQAVRTSSHLQQIVNAIHRNLGKEAPNKDNPYAVTVCDALRHMM